MLDLLPEPPSDRLRTIVDLGSGAGFPGLVLALLGAGAVALVESDSRKATFLREAIRVTQAPHVTVHNRRIEALPPLQADVITARACAPLSRLAGYAAPLLAPGGTCLFLKGQSADAELTALGERGKITVERFPSATSPDSVILRIGGIEA